MLDIKELRNKPHLSVSAINDYIDCGLLYKFSRVDKLDADFKPDALVYGSTIHKVLAEFNQAVILGDQFTVDNFIKSFKLHWKNEAEESYSIIYNNGKSFEILMDDGVELLKAFYENMPDDNNINILAVEEPFQFTIQGVDVPIIGVMDLVEEDESGVIVISDYKTASKAYSAAQVEKNFQMTVYQMAAKANGYANREILLRLDCLIKTKIPKFQQYYTSRSDKDLRRAERKIIEVWEGIQKGVFIPNDTGWKCKYCQYKSHCDKWFDN